MNILLIEPADVDLIVMGEGVLPFQEIVARRERGPGVRRRAGRGPGQERRPGPD